MINEKKEKTDLNQITSKDTEKKEISNVHENSKK